MLTWSLRLVSWASKSSRGRGWRPTRPGPMGCSCRTSNQRSLRCQVLIGADGAASKVRKQILANAKETPHRLFVTELNVPAPEGLRTSMVYDFGLMKRGLCGYVWLFPAPGNRLNVGLMHYPNRSKNLSGRELTELLRDGLAPYGVELPAKGVRGWPVWGYHPDAKISETRVLTVGDAAGIDGLTGEGIAVAMEQAVVAGDAVHAALVGGDFAFANYRRSIRRCDRRPRAGSGPLVGQASLRRQPLERLVGAGAAR